MLPIGSHGTIANRSVTSQHIAPDKMENRTVLLDHDKRISAAADISTPHDARCGHDAGAPRRRRRASLLRRRHPRDGRGGRRAGCRGAKISLYRAFDTKDNLVGAYLDRRRTAYWRQWDKLADMHDDPRDKVLAVIGHLADRTTTPGYRGCPFMNSAIEFPDPDSPEHRSAMAMKQEVRGRLRELCTPLTSEPDRLADELFLLIRAPTPQPTPSAGKTVPPAPCPEPSARYWPSHSVILRVH